MSPPYGVARRMAWRRRSLLLALAGLHGLAFLLWPAPERAPSGVSASERRITWLTLPAVTRPAPQLPRRASVSGAAALLAAPQAITLAPVTRLPEASAPDPFAVAPAAAAP
ncbi:MAG: hypothetical protein ACEQSK_15445, partial [Sphingomonadaceae bacterium]